MKLHVTKLRDRFLFKAVATRPLFYLVQRHSPGQRRGNTTPANSRNQIGPIRRNQA